MIHEIIDRAESERFTSSLILYCALLHECMVSNTTHSSIKTFPGINLKCVDRKVERWIGDFSKLQKFHEFDERSAVYNLQKIKLVDIEGDLDRDEEIIVHVKPIDQAIQILREQTIASGQGVYSLQEMF